ncbi:MAG: PQQ-binding-like beta-propeller repeat protein [Rhodopirellula sp.]|nr:PQQ-binding-like beta-propeller repeat protein [Rhodopirellula sp.]
MTDLQLRWQVPLLGEGAAGIAVYEGSVAVADHAEHRDVFRLIDLGTGRERWRCERDNPLDLDYGSAPRATPLFAGDCMFVLGAGGELLSLGLAGGNIRWTRNLLTDFGPTSLPTWGYCCSPLIADARLIVNPGAHGAAVVAIEPATGTRLWSVAGEAPNYSSFVAGPFGGVIQVAGYDQKGLCGWACDSGRLLWRVATGLGKGYVVPTPVAWEGKLIVAHEKGTELYAFRPDGAVNPHPLATTRQLSPAMGTPTLAKDWLLGHDNRRVIALSLKDSLNLRWKGPADPRQKGLAHLAVQEDGARAIVFCQSGWAFLLDLSGPEPAIIDQRELTGTTWAHPAVLETALVCRDATALYCYQIPGG